MENGSTDDQSPSTLSEDGSEDREPPENCGDDALCERTGILPEDVSSRVFGPNSVGASRLQGGCPEVSRTELGRIQREAVIASPTLSPVACLGSIDARGTEHRVRFRGRRVEKHQHSSGWTPQLTLQGKLKLDNALPSEYLRRLELQNQLFGDDIQIIGRTSGNRFASTQPTLKGGEPSENEIRDVLEDAGWTRIPITLQDLPPPLMGSAWWHDEEEIVLLDARKPNFKKTEFGVLPIDLILADLTAEIREVIEASLLHGNKAS